MSVHKVEELAIPGMQDVLLFDAVDMEWRIGHARAVIEGVEPFLCAVTVQEAHDLITSDIPVPVFTEVSHWARLPDKPGEPA